MQPFAASSSVKQAVRILKHMDLQAPEWHEVQDASREATRRIIEDRMQARVGHYLADRADRGEPDRRNGGGALRRPVLVALGITPAGRKEILDFTLAPGESQAAWERWLTELERRGLQAEQIELIASDGGQGLLAALAMVYPGIPVQR